MYATTVCHTTHPGAVDKTSSSFSAHGKIGNFIIIIIVINHHETFARKTGIFSHLHLPALF